MRGILSPLFHLMFSPPYPISTSSVGVDGVDDADGATGGGGGGGGGDDDDDSASAVSKTPPSRSISAIADSVSGSETWI